MAEMVMDRTDEMDIFVHPRSGAVYFELEDYVSDCVVQLSDPNPLPENGMSTLSVAEPVIEHLTDSGTSREHFWYTLDYLKYIYVDPSPDPASTVRDERDARRNFVADVIYGVQKWAIENDDRAMSADVTKLTCDLMEQDIIFGADDYGEGPHAVNRILAASLQNVVAKQAADISLYDSDEGLEDKDIPRWFDVDDILRMRDCLSCALMADKLNLSEMTTVRFLLQSYGLDSEKLLDTWTYGFFDGSPEAPVNTVIKDNLHRIVTIEARRFGISKRLFDSRNIQCFARLSPEFLLYLDDPHKRPVRAGIFTATFDASVVGEAFNDPAMYDRLLREVRAAGHDLEYFEYASVQERDWCDSQARGLGIVHVLRQEHSDPIQGKIVQLGGQGRQDSVYHVGNMKVFQSELIKARYKGVRSLAWFGCGVALDGGLVDTLTSILRGVSVRGLTRSTGVDSSYSANGGFYMKKNKKRTPAPIFHDKSGRSRMPTWVADQLDPPIVERVRYADEVEEAMRYGDAVMRSVL
ncbi:MAG TPA: hypothetical protein VLG47_05690 [Candidatus Saccharimonadales bacterium]|nr:hypothetical protein [Candidatus Saccharimonadales bacterium]